MPDPNPFIDNPRQRPYEVLGISPSASFEEARKAAREIKKKHSTKAKKHKGSDEDARNRHLDAVENATKALKILDNRDASNKGPSNREPLTIDVVDDRIVVGREATFIIKEASGDRANGAKLEHDGRNERANQNGEVEMRFQNTGEQTVRATKSGDHLAAEATIDVVEVRQMVVEPIEDPTVGPTEFRVTDGDGTPVNGATVHVPGGNRATTAGGTAELDLDMSDGVVRAEKSGGSHVEYLDAETSIDVGKRTVQLEIVTQTDDPVVGKPVTFQVLEAGTKNPVPDAEVGVKETEQQQTTGPDGTVTFNLKQERPTIGTDKSDDPGVEYKLGTVSPRLRKQKGKIQLEGPDTVTTNQQATFTVTDGTNSPIQDAGVEAVNASVATGRTDSDGEAEIMFDVNPETTVQLRATKDDDIVDYGDATHTVEVEERDRALSIVTYPKQPTVGQPAEFVVEDEAGDPVAARLKGVPCGGVAQTDPSNGRGELVFQNAIPSTVTAESEDIDDEDTVTVSPKP